MKNPKSADGLKGLLCRSLDGRFFFRVYDEENREQFTDYDLAHSDLAVTINDDDAFIYEREGEHEPVIDHSPATLGLKF